MTLQKAINIFQILLDKYGSPDVVPSEAIDLLNGATNEYLNRMFPDSQGGVVNFEMDANILANIKPLIWTVSANMDANGLLSDSALQTLVRTKSGDTGAKVFRVTSMGMTVSGKVRPVKFVRQNHFWAYDRNFFKRPSTKAPVFTLQGNGFQFSPIQQTAPITISVIKTPKVLTNADLNSEMEFSDYVVFNLISIALKMAAVSVRDTEVLEDVRLAGLQIAQ